MTYDIDHGDHNDAALELQRRDEAKRRELATKQAGLLKQQAAAAERRAQSRRAAVSGFVALVFFGGIAFVACEFAGVTHMTTWFDKPAPPPAVTAAPAAPAPAPVKSPDVQVLKPSTVVVVYEPPPPEPAAVPVPVAPPADVEVPKGDPVTIQRHQSTLASKERGVKSLTKLLGEQQAELLGYRQALYGTPPGNPPWCTRPQHTWGAYDWREQTARTLTSIRDTNSQAYQETRVQLLNWDAKISGLLNNIAHDNEVIATTTSRLTKATAERDAAKAALVAVGGAP